MSTYCRFCAEEKPCVDLSALAQPDQKSVIEKLSFIGIALVDFSNKKLPRTVCFDCNELIHASYEFFLKVKRSQVFLSELCGIEVESETSLESNIFAAGVAVKQESDDDVEYLQEEASSWEKKGANPHVFVKKDDAVKEESYFTKEQNEGIDHQSTWASYPWHCACGLCHSSLAALRTHCRAEHRTCAAFQCVDCNQRLDDFHEFVMHVRSHRKVLRNYCEYCNIHMVDPSHPDLHMAEHSCTFCGEVFLSQGSLNDHLKQYAAQPTGLLAFNLEIFDLDDSNIRNWAEYPTVCQYCNLKVVDKEVLSEHCVEAHRKCFGSQCVDCEERVDCYQDFIDHVKRHRPHLKNICPYCNINMEHEDMLHVNEHIVNQHPCALCGELFTSKRSLRAHVALVDPSPLITPPKKRRRGPVTDKDLTCAVCGMVMKSPTTLKVHIRTQHTVRKRNYTCDRCGKAYYTKGSLVVHHKIHENVMKETCKICHKAFLTIHRLRKHIKTHNLVMPFQCDQCKRFFSSKDRLREHVKVHMDIMPFQCQYCSKKFRHKSIMKTHENQHTGARPYSCNICCMDFANWSNCNKHMKRKHGATLAQHAMTPYGKLRLDPTTGRVPALCMDQGAKRWSQMMLSTREKGKKNMQLQCNSETENKK